MSGVDPAAKSFPVPPRVSVWNAANALTAVRIVLVPLCGWLLLAADGRSSWRWAAAGAFLLAIATDRFDGEIARRRHLITDVGKIADPIADKALIGTALVCLSVIGALTWWVTVVVLIREVLVTALRFVVIRRVVLPAGRGGKVKTALQAVAIGMYLAPLGGWWTTASAVVMAVAVVLTVLTGLDYLIGIRRVLSRARSGG